ncbi:MAG TPA: glutathione peroxidase [Puia sp.]|nr:glutathione peroxidase [Puia sp.]
MTTRQKILKAVYPFLLWVSNVKSKTKMLANEKNIQPVQSLYELKVMLNNGDSLDLGSLKGKKILVVNTASDCGYTPQYNDLEILYEKYMDKLTVVGFPANDFGEQEKQDDKKIAEFCKMNFGITFPLAKKSTVIKSPQQNSIFKWLTDAKLNGWNNQQPKWNFSKYLIDENGVLLNYFDSSVSPDSEQIKKALEQ